MSFRPTLLISRCILGEPVRYDGRSKPYPSLVNTLSEHCTLIPLCPEVEAGLSTPRPPVQLVLKQNQVVAQGRDDTSLEVTTELQQFSHHYLSQYTTLHGAVLQNRSPSCGVSDTPLYSPQQQLLERRDGLFTEQLRQHNPSLLIRSPEQLNNPAQQSAFVKTLHEKFG